MLLARIPMFDEAKLAAIEQNARRLAKTGTDAQKTEAGRVLSAITVERQQREHKGDQSRSEAAAEIAEKVKDKGLFDRVVLAFSEMPPEDWEMEVLNEIAAGPGRDFDTLAHAVGERGGGYINFALGSLCSTRKAYLGPALLAKGVKDTKVYTALLIDFTSLAKSEAVISHGWTLKPEAEAALCYLGIIRPVA